MAYFFDEPSHTFGEYLLVPGYTPADYTPDRVTLKTPVVKFDKKNGEKCMWRSMLPTGQMGQLDPEKSNLKMVRSMRSTV